MCVPGSHALTIHENVHSNHLRPSPLPLYSVEYGELTGHD